MLGKFNPDKLEREIIPESQKGLNIVIVGAGAGGIATAALLAHKGHSVTVIEKNAFSGGRCSIIEKGGFRFDQGPSLFMMPAAFERIFQDLGENLHDHVDLIRVTPHNYVVHFEDSQVCQSTSSVYNDFEGKKTTKPLSDQIPNKIRLSSDLVHMRKELEMFEKGSFEKFLAFLEESRRHYDLSVEYVLQKNYSSWNQIFQLDLIPLALKLDVFTSCYGNIAKYFKSEKLRRAFTFQSMYLGMNPFNAPGTYNLLQFTEFAEGIWYPSGGFHKVIGALEKISEDHGANYIFSTAVTKIETDSETKKAIGVHVKNSNGSEQFIKADAIVCNADLIYAYNSIIPNTPSTSVWADFFPKFTPESPNYNKYLTNLDHTCSTISFYWGMSTKIEGLEPHNIFLSDDYQKSFDDIFCDLKLPQSPSFYVHVPSKLDPSIAPPGKEVVIVLVPTGHMSNEDSKLFSNSQDCEGYAEKRMIRDKYFEQLKETARFAVISTIKKKIGVDISVLIEVEDINTPVTWMNKFNLSKGSALGLSHPIFQVLWFRPRTRHSQINNLFFVGASTHPGTGVPIVMYCARLVVDQLLQAATLNFNIEHANGIAISLMGLIGFIFAAVFYLVFKLTV
ncbi:hypothetical protein HK096_011038 [Nowakowskiella sp. JEL0078]|nr:hypothetical protein HK096_011038 [Nowakowskiella sp. JEL0078]